ncbi:hypothetical protein NERG_01444 [Nematocida ausubeli]|uniref:Chromatin assembly factor 1 subunit A dimerization domain-containing protein n=1 Tax=Nematocida ausubeli (strain ATCC PRA-371 / ERTm2) TaxID=1913371 RepID=H8ZCK1_NEMA1|nr:hypothetical protein NERG_01444 [Nematocida ausubeli]
MNLRFSIDALQMLIAFKASKDIFPSKTLMNLFSDLLPIHENTCLLSFLTESAYEYFYSCRHESIPTKEEFMEWTKKWIETTHARVLKTELSRYKPSDQQVGIASASQSVLQKHFVVIDNNEISTSSVSYKARRKLIDTLKSDQKENNPAIKRARVSLSEDILKCPKKKPLNGSTQPPTKVPPSEEHKTAKTNLLSFMTKRSGEKAGLLTNGLSIKYPGRFYGKVTTIRLCKEISKPVRMVFYQIHGQIRPSFYAVKPSTYAPNILHTRNTIRKILQPEEYLYDSEEEWIEEDGESIDKESEESDDDESGNAEWVEEDTNTPFFSKGQLPEIDYPLLTVLTVDESTLE